MRSCDIGRYGWCGLEMACFSFAHMSLLTVVGIEKMGRQPSTGPPHPACNPVPAVCLWKNILMPARKTGRVSPAKAGMSILVSDPE